MTKNKEDICKRAIHIFWETTWQEEKTEKSTLKYLSLRYRMSKLDSTLPMEIY